MLTHLLPTTPLDLFLHLSLAGLLILSLSTLLTATLLRRSSAAARHLIWTAASLGLLCLPAFALLPSHPNLPPYLAPLPRLDPLPALPLEPLPISPAQSLPSPPPSRFTFYVFTSPSFLFPLYTLGLLTSLTPLLAGPLLLRRLRTRSTRTTDESLLSTLNDCRQTLSLSRPVTLLLSPSPTAMPLAFGLLRPHILLPADAPTWTPARLRLVLSHELAHVKRHDILSLYLAQLARAVHWFNPLAYLAVSRMLTERERACDDLVLRATAARPSDYADTLLHLSTTLGNAPSLLPAMPMSRGPSHLHTRLRAILNPTLNRSPLTRRLTIAALLLAPVIALPLSCSRADKSQPSATQPPLAGTQRVPGSSTQPAANPNAPWPADVEQCARNLRDLSSALLDYAGAHDRHYPSDLGPTVDLITRTTTRESADHHQPTAAELARRYRCPLLAANVPIPDQVTPDWVRQHATYTYLGSDKIRLGDFTDDQWDHTVILHDDLDHPHQHPYFGTVTIVAYLNGSAELLPVEEARKQIEASKKTLADAAKNHARANAPMPADILKSASNLHQIGQFILLYANDHQSLLPPDLGATLPYAHARTPAETARIYLVPPHDQEVAAPASADWINKHTPYVYLGSPSLHLRDIPASAAATTILVHEDLATPHTHPNHGPVINVLYVDGHAELLPLNTARTTIATSRQTLADLSNQSPHSAPPSSNPQSAIPNPQSERPLSFDLGHSSFLPGDSITISQVLDLTPPKTDLTLARTLKVIGTYTLASHDAARLGAEITSNDPLSGHGSYTPITKGTNQPFSLTFTLSGNGNPHVSFYPAQGRGQSFGGIYFGSGPTLYKDTPQSNAKPTPSGVGNIDTADLSFLPRRHTPNPNVWVGSSPLISPPSVITGGTITVPNGKGHVLIYFPKQDIKSSDTLSTGSADLRLAPP